MYPIVFMIGVREAYLRRALLQFPVIVRTDDILGTYGVDLTPAEPLSVLAEEPAAGTWQLTVHDQAGGDTGTLNSWSVEVGGRPFETWSGTLAVDASEMMVHRVDAGRANHASEQSIPSSRVPVRAPHFERASAVSRPSARG